MSNEVRWVKLLTSLPDDEKIKIIESLPERDAIFYIWIRLLIQAGKCNDDGFIYLAPDIPFTDEHLSTIFNRPITTIRLAISTFINLRMIEIYENGHIFLPKFAEIQNIEGLAKLKEQARIRQANYRERRKQLPEGVTQTVTLRNGTDKIRIDKIRIDKIRIDKNKNRYNDKNNDYCAIAQSTIKEYFKNYKRKTGNPHPNLHQTQLASVAGKISDDFKRLKVKRVKDAKKLVAAHFDHRGLQRDFETDWNINHFASGSIIQQLWESPSCAIFREKAAASKR